MKRSAPCRGSGPRPMGALTLSISTYRVALNVEVQSAERGRERREIFCGSGWDMPATHPAHIPFASNHCMAGKWHLAESLRGQRRDPMDGEARTASDYYSPGNRELFLGLMTSCQENRKHFRACRQ